MTLPVPFDTAVADTTAALQTESFGVALGIVGTNPALQDVAREADERLRRPLATLESAASK